MTRDEFMAQLEQLLAGSEPEEREEALRYYSECFAEAGPEGEQALLEELESPARVAAILRANVPGAAAQPAPEQPEEKPLYIRGLDDAPHAPQPEKPYEAYDYAKGSTAQPVQRNNSNRILFILALIVLFPLWGGLLGGVLGLLGGLIGALCGLVGGGFGMIVAGIWGFFRAALAMLAGQTMAATVLAMGMSLLSFGGGILMFAAGIWCFGTVVPWVVRTVMNLIKRVLGKGGRTAA